MEPLQVRESYRSGFHISSGRDQLQGFYPPSSRQAGITSLVLTMCLLQYLRSYTTYPSHHNPHRDSKTLHNLGTRAFHNFLSNPTLGTQSEFGLHPPLYKPHRVSSDYGLAVLGKQGAYL